LEEFWGRKNRTKKPGITPGSFFWLKVRYSLRPRFFSIGSICGRFAQAQTRDEYLVYLAKEAERDIAYDPEPIGRYNIAPDTQGAYCPVRHLLGTPPILSLFIRSLHRMKKPTGWA